MKLTYFIFSLILLLLMGAYTVGLYIDASRINWLTIVYGWFTAIWFLFKLYMYEPKIEPDPYMDIDAKKDEL